MKSGDDHWDRFRIKAEVERRGASLTAVARDAGLSSSACRVALLGGSRAGAQALSDFLGVPIQKLFPGFYLRLRSTRRKPTPKQTAESRQNGTHPKDDVRLRA